MKNWIGFFQSLDLSGEQRECIVWKTAARLFKLDPTRLPPT